MSAPSHQTLIERLRDLPSFKEMDQADVVEIARGAVWREYGRGEAVFFEGDATSGLHVLAFGRLKVVKYSTEGREQVLRYLGPGETFNEIGVFANRPNPATAIALEPAGAWQLQHEAMMRMVLGRPELARRVIESMADRVIDLVNMVADLSLRSVAGRVAKLVLDEAAGDAVPRDRWHSQAELAARLGTVPDVLQRVLRSLESERLIEVSRQEIRILNRAALERLAL